MKLNEHTIGPAARTLANRWRLKLGDRVAETPRAFIFQAEGREGLCALKIYKQLGMGGEGSAVHFLRNLPPDTGVKIYRSSLVRSAMLMEWLEGPGLDQVLTNGAEGEATEMLAQVAQAISKTPFKWPFLYRRVATGTRRDLQNSIDQSTGPHDAELRRALQLLDHLTATAQEKVLHGDLGFSNVIATADGPRLIDPKGLRADPAFEFSKSLITPFNFSSVDELITRIDRRGAVFANAIGVPQQRLVQWATIVMAHSTFRNPSKHAFQKQMKPYLMALLDLSEKQ